MLMRSRQAFDTTRSRDAEVPGAVLPWSEFADLLATGIGVVDRHFGVVQANAAFNALVGGNPRSRIGKPLHANSTLDPSALRQIHRLLVHNGRWSGIIPHLGKSLRVSLLAREAQRSGYLIEVSDHADFTAQERRLVEAGKEIDRLTRERSDFLSQTGHELRTPLNSVLGFAQLLKIDAGLSDEQKDYVNEIVAASNYLLSLINQILKLSKVDHEHTDLKLAREELRTCELIRECIALVQPLAQKGGIEIRQSASSVVLTQDRVRLKQVLLNLISNAIKYNSDGHGIVVQSFIVTSGIARIEVQDSGKGIPSALQKTIFNPFERLGVRDNQIEGSGIGLMITRRLAKLMNGKVGVVSEAGCGSVFWLDFPVTAPHAPRHSTRLSEAARNVFWVGGESVEQAFGERLLGLRPALRYRRLDSLVDALSLCADLTPDLLFVNLDEAYFQLKSLAATDKNLLKDVGVVVVVNSNSAFEHVDGFDLRLVGRLAAPYSAIAFMEIVDQWLYPESTQTQCVKW